MAYQNELYHYGTLGMKWGVRRYQNRDGSLTPAGKKRYAKLNSELNKLRPGASKDRQSEYNKHAGVSDDELKARIARLKLEDEYSQLASKLNPKKVKDGESFVVKAGKYAAKSIFDAWVKKTFELDDQGKKKDGKQGKQDSSNKNDKKSEDSKNSKDPKAKTDAYREKNKRLELQIEREELKRKKKAQNEQYKEEDREKRAYRKATRTTDPYNPYWLY
nr:MAG TPA: hypothetical protein [Caudoviricetes sp.]